MPARILPAPILIIAAVVAACTPSATDRPPTGSVPVATIAPSPAATPPATGPGQPGATAQGSQAVALPTFRSDAWTRIDDAPASLTEVAATAHQGRIWVAGGLGSDGAADDRVFVFDPRTGAWASGPRLPEGVHHAVLVSAGMDLYLIGGYGGSLGGSPTAAVRRLDENVGRWVDGPTLPAARGAGAAAWDGARVVFGGGVSTSGVSREVWVLEGGAWRVVGALSRAREHLGATSDGQGRAWFLGGRAQSLAANVGTIEIVEGNAIRAAAAGLTPRSGVAAFWSPASGACLAGGEGPAGTHAEVECVSADGRVTVHPRLGVSRHGVGAAVVEGVAYVVLGGEQPGLFVSAVVEAIALASR